LSATFYRAVGIEQLNKISSPIWILAFDHKGYLGADSAKFIGRLTDPLLVDSFLQT
jgi:hypothetical protein